MPSLASHLVCAKLVGKKLGLTDSDFVIGNVLPDLDFDVDASHFKKPVGEIHLPDIDYARKSLNNGYNVPMSLGKLSHIMLEHKFLTQYVPQKFGNHDILRDGSPLYDDYTTLDPMLFSEFDCYDQGNIFNKIRAYRDETNIRVMKDLDPKKLEQNEKFMSTWHENRKLKCLDHQNFSGFLRSASNEIAKEIYPR